MGSHSKPQDQKKLSPQTEGSSLAADMALLYLITYASASIRYEGYISQKAAFLLGILFFAVFIASWVIIAFLNGRQKKISFVIISTLSWLLPQLIIYLSDSGPRAFRMSVTAYVLDEFFTFVSEGTCGIISGLFGGGIFIGAVIMTVICGLAFAAGFKTADTAPRKKKKR